MDKDESRHGRLNKYHVNFTYDLSNTLSEVTILERLGYTVPEVARNMSIQENKLTGIARDLKSMVDRYHECSEHLEDAEMELMMEDINYVHQGLRPGHTRLTWNYLGIGEYLSHCNHCISVLMSRIRQINLIRVQLLDCIERVVDWELLL